MATAINKGKVAPQSEFSDASQVIVPITKNAHKGPAIKTANKTVKILVYLDGTGIAETALRYIEDYTSMLAPEVKIKIHLLQVITHMTHYRLGDGVVTMVPYTEDEIKQTTDKATDYLNQAGEPLRSKGLTVATRVGIKTEPSKKIVKTAEEISADLIVMFTHKRSWLSRLAFGSVTDKVLRREDDVPVMVVRVDDYS
ncbi:universal stress protein [Chloroflexota bacterium]